MRSLTTRMAIAAMVMATWATPVAATPAQDAAFVRRHQMTFQLIRAGAHPDTIWGLLDSADINDVQTWVNLVWDDRIRLARQTVRRGAPVIVYGTVLARSPGGYLVDIGNAIVAERLVNLKLMVKTRRDQGLRYGQMVAIAGTYSGWHPHTDARGFAQEVPAIALQSVLHRF